MSGFDYPYTCPTIDKAIANAKQEIASHIESILTEVCPMLKMGHVEEMATDYTEAIYKDIEDAFESARKSNSDMRDEADDQITVLQERVEVLEHEIKQHEL